MGQKENRHDVFQNNCIELIISLLRVGVDDCRDSNCHAPRSSQVLRTHLSGDGNLDLNSGLDVDDDLLDDLSWCVKTVLWLVSRDA